MDILNGIMLGMNAALSWTNLAYCFLGVFVGTAIGILPGLIPWRQSPCFCRSPTPLSR